MKLYTTALLASSLLAGLVGAAASSVPAHATETEWVMVGEQTVSTRADQDVMVLGADEGRYEALRFEVFGNRVAFARVKVVYGNGTSEVLNVQEHVRPGMPTPAYDLTGLHRIIKRIEFLYQAENPWKGDAIIKVFGKKDVGDYGNAGNPGNCSNPDGWTVLGKREVNLVVDHDSINLGFGAGRFRAIRFHVSGEPIHLYDMQVTFANGQVQTLDFNENIAPGAYSRSFDLAGNERVISRIDLVYRKMYQGGRALMTVYGQS
jgi:hypothetical protein